MAKSWCVYLGKGDPSLVSSYGRISVKHTGLCGNSICAIYAEGESFRPEAPLSINLQSYIKKALATGALQPERPTGSKKFVYLRYIES